MDYEKDKNSKVKVNIGKLKHCGVGKLSSQGTGTFPYKGRRMARWLDGDKLSYWVDFENNHMLVVNETLNEPITIETKFFNELLCENFNGAAQVVIFEGDHNNDPLNQLTNYLKEYKGYIDPMNPDKGKLYMDDIVIKYIDLDKTHFLKEYLRYINDEDIPGAYIFCYHNVKHSNKNETYHDAIKSALSNQERIILYGYHNIENEIGSILKKLDIHEYLYMRFKTGEEKIIKHKQPNGEEVLITTIQHWR